MKKLLFLCIAMNLAYQGIASEYDVAKINRLIKENGADWTASENRITGMTAEQRKLLCGEILQPQDITAPEMLSIQPVENLPAQLDWRDNGGNWVTPVRDQGQCGSCWDFSAVAQIEAWWKIYHSDADSMIDLSEQFILSCSDAGNCAQGGWTYKALDWVKYNGVPLENCMEYLAADGVPCSDACDDWQEQAVTIPGWGWITYDKDIVENIKSALYRHPVSASYTVYSDFYSYHGGVYEHVYGNVEGGHAILIVGWNDEEQSWICKNSWGSDWGEDGYFRIKWGDSQMGDYIPFIYDGMTSRRSVQVSPENFNFYMTVGDSAIHALEVQNIGQNNLEFAAMDFSYDANAPHWIEIMDGGGVLAPGETAALRFMVKTRELIPGSYNAKLGLRSNDSYKPLEEISCRLNLIAPDHDIKVSHIMLPDAYIRIFSYMKFSAALNNEGLSEELDFDVLGTIRMNDQVIFSDTTHVSTISPNEVITVEFDSTYVTQSGLLDLHVEILNLGNDYNSYNDYANCDVEVKHLVDNFEQHCDSWVCEGGWGISDRLNGHSGSHSAHVNAGAFPYLNDMSGTMTYAPGFDLHAVKSAVLKYYTRYATDEGNDICFVEVSGDYMNWNVMDSISGLNLAWIQREVNLTDFIKPEYPKVWVRFRFISNSEITNVGVLIDDVEIYPLASTGVQNREIDARIPDNWALFQNYPNPFNPKTTIRYRIQDDVKVTIKIFDMLGNEIVTLVNGFEHCGTHSVEWNGVSGKGKPAASGIYLYSIQAGDYRQTKKMMFLK